MKNIVISAGIALSLLVGLLGLIRPAVVEKVTQKLGSAAGPDLPFDHLSVSGVTTYSYRSNNLLQATTTVCSITSPVATSTLKYASLRLSTGSTTAMAVDISKGAAGASGSTASTSSRFNGTGNIVPANSQYDMVASSTGLGSALDTFAPNTQLNFTLDGGVTFGLFVPVGACQAKFDTVI